ncbi:hypothetical protein HN588_05685, partial [Candidatus Bathyarchaeota archaeon]|nr:hypothetical protein [Candidatus Bathyarchaeota archaeon]
MAQLDFGTVLRDYCYAYFGWAGKGLTSVFRDIEKDLDAASMSIHPEVYFSLVGVVAIISGVLPMVAFGFISLGLFRLPA